MKRVVLSLGLLISSGLVFAAAGGGGASDPIDETMYGRGSKDASWDGIEIRQLWSDFDRNRTRALTSLSGLIHSLENYLKEVPALEEQKSKIEEAKEVNAKKKEQYQKEKSDLFNLMKEYVEIPHRYYTPEQKDAAQSKAVHAILRSTHSSHVPVLEESRERVQFLDEMTAELDKQDKSLEDQKGKIDWRMTILNTYPTRIHRYKEVLRLQEAERAE